MLVFPDQPRLEIKAYFPTPWVGPHCGNPQSIFASLLFEARVDGSKLSLL